MPRGGRRSTSWQPGRSANPGGKPKRPATIAARRVEVDVKALARAIAPEAVETLKTIMLDAKAPPAARIGAATAILDRGYGKARQDVGLSGGLDLSRIDGMSPDELDQLERLLTKPGSETGPATAHRPAALLERAAPPWARRHEGFRPQSWEGPRCSVSIALTAATNCGM